MPEHVFRDITIVTDRRVNDRLRVCLDCNEVLRIRDDRDVFSVFGQCPECGKVYVLKGPFESHVSWTR